jgi:hemerythrin-like domain-containing protein
MEMPGKSIHASRHSASDDAVDAVSLLISDHEELRQLFLDYAGLVEAGASDEEKEVLVEEICNQLSVHSSLEEDLFYPAARDALADIALLNKAESDHQRLAEMIVELQSMDASDEQYDDRVMVLEETFEEHIDEEENEMFPQLADSAMDLEQLGEQMSARKDELQNEVGRERDFDDEDD